MNRSALGVVVLLCFALSGCIAAKAVGATARIATSAVVTTVDVTTDVVGGAARAVTGGGEDEAE